MPTPATLASVVILAPSAFAADRIESYGSLVEHLLGGGAVRAVVDACKTEYKVNDAVTEAPDVRLGFSFAAWQHFGAATVQNERAFVTLYARYDAYVLSQSANAYLVEVRVDSRGDGELRIRHVLPRSADIPMLVEYKGGIAGEDAPIKLFKYGR